MNGQANKVDKIQVEKILEDPKRAVYEELEKFVQRYMSLDESNIHVASVYNLYHEYEKEADKPLTEREFMYKIALEHPEFGLVYRKRGWLFTRCEMRYKHI